MRGGGAGEGGVEEDADEATKKGVLRNLHVQDSGEHKDDLKKSELNRVRI